MQLQKEFSNTPESALASFRKITPHSSSDQADLTQLFRAAAHEAKRSRAQNRILRLVSSIIFLIVTASLLFIYYEEAFYLMSENVSSYCVIQAYLCPGVGCSVSRQPIHAIGKPVKLDKKCIIKQNL